MSVCPLVLGHLLGTVDNGEGERTVKTMMEDERLTFLSELGKLVQLLKFLLARLAIEAFDRIFEEVLVLFKARAWWDVTTAVLHIGIL